MSALDGGIVNALLPVLREALGCGVAEVEWVVTAYLLAVGSVILSFGRLGDLRGHRDVYLFGFVGFSVSSALCGVAPSVGWLVGFRVLQGVSAAMMLANAPAILTRSFPPEQRGRVLGLQAVMTYLGLSVGPPLGGVLARHLGWRSVFFVNVPLGLLGVVAGVRKIARDRPEGLPPPFDVAGALLYFAGLLSLLLALNQGHAWGWTASPTLALSLVAALVLVAFVAVERRRTHPMLDLSLFGSTAFTASALSAAASYIGLFAVLFLLPFQLIQGRHLPADRAAVVLTALPVLMAVTAPVAGALSDRIGSRWPSAAGMGVLSLGVLALSLAIFRSSLAWTAAALGVTGAGFGAFIAPNTSRLLGAAPRHRQGIASGVLVAARYVGMMLGVGLSGAVYTTMLAIRGSGAVTDAVSKGLQLAGVITALAVATSFAGGSGAES